MHKKAYLLDSKEIETLGIQYSVACIIHFHARRCFKTTKYICSMLKALYPIVSNGELMGLLSVTTIWIIALLLLNESKVRQSGGQLHLIL